MPRMNGLEATAQIRRRFPDVKILILSMYDDDEYVLQIIQAGASGYVLKRVAADDLVRAIREVYRRLVVPLPADRRQADRGLRAAGPRRRARRTPTSRSRRASARSSS